MILVKRWSWKSLNLTKVVVCLALRARALLLVFEKFTLAYLFQIALEIMWLPILIAELSGGRRQSPIIMGGEDQSLGSKDTPSIGPVDSHWTHFHTNSVRYQSRLTQWHPLGP